MRSVLALFPLLVATLALPASDPPSSPPIVKFATFEGPSDTSKIKFAGLSGEAGPFRRNITRATPIQDGCSGSFFSFVPIQQPDPKVDPNVPKPKGKPRGLKPTPKHKLFSAKQFDPKGVALSASITYVPAKLSMWGNDTYGDCVTAEEGFNQAACGTFIQDTILINWAKKNGYLNGADLTEVMDSMIASGFQQGGNTYSIGSYATVNYTDEPTLQAALMLGPVNIGIDANALPGDAGNKMGWYATGGKPGQFTNEDHCVSVAGYGLAQTLFSAVGSPVPAGFSTTKTYYLLFTWSTIGVIDHDWLMSTCGEAWVRNPSGTTNGKPTPPNPPPPIPPIPPVPPIPPIPPVPPVPPVPGNFSGTITTTKTYLNGTVLPGETVVVTPTGAGINTVDDAIAAALADPKVVAALGAMGIKGLIPSGLIIKIVAAVLPVIIADIQAGKTPAQMIPDIINAILKALLSATPEDLKTTPVPFPMLAPTKP